MTASAVQMYERVLILRCQTGDEAAFAELVGLYGPRLHYYLRKMLGRRGDVEDVTQEVWIDVLRGLPRLADIGAFSAWLYRIAHNRALQRYRHQAQPYASLDEATIVPQTQAEEVLAVEDAAQVHAALDELPAEQREVLILRFVEGMSYEQIAAAAACELGTVRSRLHYAKRALRCAIERMNDDG